MSFDADSRRRLSYGADSLLLIVLCLLFFWRDLTPAATDRRRFVAGDFAHQHYAPARYAAGRWWAGEAPLWNPYVYAGHPFVADLQNATFYPPRLVAIALAGPDFPYEALELEALLHFPLVALFTYLLARRLTGRRIGGLVAAVTFAFSSYLTGYPILQLAILEAQAWLPAILLCLLNASETLATGETRRSLRWSLAAGALLALSWLAGSPQASLLVTYGALAFAAFQLWPRPLTWAWRVWRPRLTALIVFGAVGFGLAAVQLLPAVEFMRLSTRAHIGFEEAGAGFTPYDLWQLALPAVARPFTALYLGVLPVGLAALALIRGRRAPARWPADVPRHMAFWGWSGLIALLLSFGKHLAGFAVFYLLVPGWSLFRQQERTIAWFVLAAAVLAGYGAAWLTGRGRVAADDDAARPVSLAYGLAAGCGLLLAAAFFVGFQAGYDALWGFTAATTLLALLLGLAALAVRSRSGAALIALLVLDLFTLNAGNHSRADQGQPFPPQPLLTIPQADDAPFRLANEEVMSPTYGNVYRLEDVGGASQLKLARYQALLDGVDRPRQWRLLGVKYVLSRREALEAPAERLMTQGGDAAAAQLYRLAEPGPRAWLVGQVIEAADDAALWARLAAADFDPQRQVLLNRRPQGYQDAMRCDGEIVWLARAPERLALRVVSEQPCILALAELDYPGWRATIDGQAAAILRIDGALRGLVVAAGDHRIEMVFRPISVYGGAFISAAVFAGAAALWIWLMRQDDSNRRQTHRKIVL